MTIFLVMAQASEEHGGWIVYGLFSSRRDALHFAATVPHETYVGARILDAAGCWQELVSQGAGEGLTPVTRADLLAAGLDFVVAA